MHCEPTDVALRVVAETRSLIESLLVSSESFDYVKAKQALKQLDRKAKELARLQVRLQRLDHTAPNIKRIDFSNPAGSAAKQAQ